MTSLIRQLKIERKAAKKRFKKEGDIVCTREATETEPARFTKFPMDIGFIKKISAMKVINAKLKKAREK